MIKGLHDLSLWRLCFRVIDGVWENKVTEVEEYFYCTASVWSMFEKGSW